VVSGLKSKFQFAAFDGKRCLPDADMKYRAMGGLRGGLLRGVSWASVPTSMSWPPYGSVGLDEQLNHAGGRADATPWRSEMSVPRALLAASVKRHPMGFIEVNALQVSFHRDVLHCWRGTFASIYCWCAANTWLRCKSDLPTSLDIEFKFLISYITTTSAVYRRLRLTAREHTV
jgi:hypothetical protein